MGVIYKNGVTYGGSSAADKNVERFDTDNCIEIPANADLEASTYMEIGEYYISSCEVAHTINHSPINNSAFRMRVYKIDEIFEGDDFTTPARMRIIILPNGDIYKQNCMFDEGVDEWITNPWDRLATKGDIDNIPNASKLSRGFMTIDDKNTLDDLDTRVTSLSSLKQDKLSTGTGIQIVDGAFHTISVTSDISGMKATKADKTEVALKADKTALETKADKSELPSESQKIYYVKGTQTSTTAKWTGNIEASSIVDGMVIAYFLPQTSASGVTLKLTLKDGSETSEIPVYKNGTTSVGTDYVANSVIYLTYNADKAAFFANMYGNSYYSLYSSTAAGTATKAASCSAMTSTKNTIGYKQILMGNANTYAGAITLNIGSSGAKPIYINGSPSSATNYDLPAGHYLAYYDGSKYDFRTDGKLPMLDDYDDIKGRVKGVQIKNGTDLNSIVTVGLFFTSGSTNANTITNTGRDGKWEKAFILTVTKWGADSRAKQIIYDGANILAMRECYMSGSTVYWSDWNEAVFKNDTDYVKLLETGKRFYSGRIKSINNASNKNLIELGIVPTPTHTTFYSIRLAADGSYSAAQTSLRYSEYLVRSSLSGDSILWQVNETTPDKINNDHVAKPVIDEGTGILHLASSESNTSISYSIEEWIFE